jgi:hypothetical protein
MADIPATLSKLYRSLCQVRFSAHLVVLPTDPAIQLTASEMYHIRRTLLEEHGHIIDDSTIRSLWRSYVQYAVTRRAGTPLRG